MSVFIPGSSVTGRNACPTLVTLEVRQTFLPVSFLELQWQAGMPVPLRAAGFLPLHFEERHGLFAILNADWLARFQLVTAVRRFRSGIAD